MYMNWECWNNMLFRQLNQLCSKNKKEMPRSFQELLHDWANFKGENQYAEVNYFLWIDNKQVVFNFKNNILYTVLPLSHQWNTFVTFNQQL